MHRIMVQPLQPGVRLTAIFDSCHSGSALDLPYIYSTSGVLKEPNLAKEAGQGLLSVISSYARGDMGGIVSSIMGVAKKVASGDSAYEKTIQTKTSPADVVMWSGSKDDQTSQDANIAGQATGAMSWAFIKALKKNPQQSYVQLLNNIRDELATRYTQKPQLSCSHPLGQFLLESFSYIRNISFCDLMFLDRYQSSIRHVICLYTIHLSNETSANREGVAAPMRSLHSRQRRIFKAIAVLSAFCGCLYPPSCNFAYF
jgi:hypothetical protein